MWSKTRPSALCWSIHLMVPNAADALPSSVYIRCFHFNFPCLLLYSTWTTTTTTTKTTKALSKSPLKVSCTFWGSDPWVVSNQHFRTAKVINPQLFSINSRTKRTNSQHHVLREQVRRRINKRQYLKRHLYCTLADRLCPSISTATRRTKKPTRAPISQLSTDAVSV